MQQESIWTDRKAVQVVMSAPSRIHPSTKRPPANIAQVFFHRIIKFVADNRRLKFKCSIISQLENVYFHPNFAFACNPWFYTFSTWTVTFTFHVPRRSYSRKYNQWNRSCDACAMWSVTEGFSELIWNKICLRMSIDLMWNMFKYIMRF